MCDVLLMVPSSCSKSSFLVWSSALRSRECLLIFLKASCS